jgi:hypothetical protein
MTSATGDAGCVADEPAIMAIMEGYAPSAAAVKALETVISA